MNYTLVGAGAIGGSMAAALSRAGADILYVDALAEHVEAMNKKGLTIRDCVNGDYTVPVRAKQIEELDEPLDVVFLATKSQHTRSAMEKIAPLLREDGYVVSLQNGLNEYVIAEYVGEKRVIGAFVNWAADYLAPGEIKFGGHSNFAIGELDGTITPRLLALKAFCEPFQNADISQNILAQLWSKQVNISTMFTTGVSHLMIPGGLEFAPSQEAVACVTLEAMQVPKKLGIELLPHDDFAPELYRKGLYQQALLVTANHYRHMVKQYTGLYRDLAVRKRRSEIDGTVGVTVKLGEELGLALPLNGLLVQMVHEIEQGQREICTENMLELQKAYQSLYPDGMAALLERV